MSRTVVVTGAAKGLGKAAAERLQAEGMKVVRIDITGDVDVTLDVSSSSTVEAFFQKWNNVDILVNCAGIAGPSSPIAETDDDAWRRTIDVNLSGTFYMCRGAVASMVRKGWGRIVNVASIAGKEGNLNQGAYSASKGGVIALTKSLGKELAHSGVLANVITPGLIRTDIVSDMSDENRERSLAKIPMGRMGEADEVAELIAWLVSDKISFSTGAIYDISGGRATY